MENRGFEVEDEKASVLLNTAVYGDVTIVVYHARSAFGGKVQGKVCSVFNVNVLCHLHKGHSCFLSRFICLFVCPHGFCQIKVVNELS